MARKGSAPALENPPSASSDDETEDNLAVNGEEEDEEDLSDEEEEKPAKPEQSDSEDSEEDDETDDDEPNKPSSGNPKQLPLTQRPPQSDSDEGSETESDLADTQKSSPTASAFTVKPIVQTAKSSAKRAAETEEDPKGRKKSKVDSEKKSGPGLVWNEDDEVAVLKGISDYKKRKGSDPFDDMGGFLEFVKGSLSFEVSKTQLSEKARRLKKKYFDHALKAENGDRRIFARSRDYNLFHVAKKVWGDEYKNGMNASVGKSEKSLVKEKEEAKKTVSNENKEVVKGDFESAYPNICAALKNESFPLLTVPVGCRDLIKEVLSSAEDKAQVLEAAWKDHHVYEMELRTKQLELVKEVGYGALDALKR